jgi:hypothetical protein
MARTYERLCITNQKLGYLCFEPRVVLVDLLKQKLKVDGWMETYILCFESIEYNETSFPIVKIVSTWFIQIVVFYYWQSLAPAYDVKMTIVNGDLDKEIYMD